MHILLGHNAYLRRTEQREVPVRWEAHAVMNAHMLIVGGSGSGKTHTLRYLIQSLVDSTAQPLRVHVFDVHGDVELPQASTVRFSEATPYGHNPLVVNPDPHCGGVRRRVQGFLAALGTTSRQLGTRQEAVLRALLTDLYAANGFYEDRPESWRLDDGQPRRYPKKHPTLQDAARFAAAKLRLLYLGADAPAVAALERVNRKAQALYAKTKAAGQHSEAAQPELAELAEQAIEAYASAVRALRTGRELDDLVRYDSRDVLRSVVERLENLNAIGIFRPEPPPFEAAAPVWRYDLRSLAGDEQKLLVHFRLEELFQRAMERGVQSHIGEIIVLDEAHRFFAENADHPLNVIAKEARKFGVGLVCASQSPTHFSEDFLANVATKMVLGIDEMYWDGSVRKLKIDLRTLQYITPKKTMAVQIKTSDASRSRYVGVELPQPRPAGAGRQGVG